MELNSIDRLSCQCCRHCDRTLSLRTIKVTLDSQYDGDSRPRSAGLVSAGKMFNAVNVQDVLFDIEGEQHSVVTTACGA